MPSRNRRKCYFPGAYYHAYNRGVEKRDVFLDQMDCSTFLNYLREYLLPKDTQFWQGILTSPSSSPKEKDEALRHLRLNNFNGRVELLAFALVSNHFHFILKQDDEDAMKELMQSCMTRYTGYFNRKYKRVGPLFQERYKALDVDSEAQLLHLSRYIHKHFFGSDILFSSYPLYLGEMTLDWLNPQDILGNFSRNDLGFNSYRDFVEGGNSDFHTTSIDLIKGIIIEDY